MKIAMLTQSYSPTGGVATYVRELRKALEKSGSKVCVIHSDLKAVSNNDPMLHYAEGFDQFETELSAKAVPAVLGFLRKEKPDVVHVQSCMNYPLEAAIRKEFPAVKSMHVHDYCPAGTKFHAALNRVCEHATGPMCLPRMVYKRCSQDKNPATLWMFYDRATKAIANDRLYGKVIAASHYVGAELLRAGYLENQIEVIPYFTQIPELSESSDESPKIILITGRLVPEKGIDRMLLAVNKLRSSAPFRVVIDGDGAAMQTLKKKAEKLDIANRVEFTGWLPPAAHWDLFRKASLVVVPSVWPEPFGLVGIEAMSYGKPVVAFKVGGIPDWLIDGESGFLIEPYNIEMLAEKIDSLLTDAALRQRMGARGREIAKEKFNEKNHVSRLLQIYQSVYESRPL